ncbi:MAG: glycosyltransferase family 2 protein [Myxococcota bacterium]
MTEFRCCAVVPTFENPETIRSVVESIRGHLADVIVIDDGSSQAGREACAALAREGLAEVTHLAENRGKGAAMRVGFAEAARLGFSHAFQIDADGQHDADAIPAFIAAAQGQPAAAVFARPVYDETIPQARRIARKITHFWVDLEVGRGVIDDALIGFRIYPLAATRSLGLVCDRMAFDVEAAVLLAWAGVPIVNLPVRVRYLTAEEGGRSHFHVVRDNARLAWLHCRLCTTASIRFCFGRPARRQRPTSSSFSESS